MEISKELTFTVDEMRSVLEFECTDCGLSAPLAGNTTHLGIRCLCPNREQLVSDKMVAKLESLFEQLRILSMAGSGKTQPRFKVRLSSQWEKLSETSRAAGR
jgi:hypothetical protein